MSRRALLTLLGAFALSVLVRWPLIDRPLSAHHEYCTAFTLIALTNWWEDGSATHHGIPSGGFVREGEGWLHPKERLGRNERARALYYFSHPPLAYDVPYVLFNILGVPPFAAGLQWMNVFFHLITVIAVFLVVRIAVGATDERAAVFAAVLYCVLPVTLWFHGNAYMSDMFVQVPWVWSLYFAMRILVRNGASARWAWFGFGTTLFLTIYTSWLGVFAAAAVVFTAFLRWRRNRDTPFFSVVLVAVLAGALAFGITAWRYLQVIDAQALFAHFSTRFEVRGSLVAPDMLPSLLSGVGVNYRIGFLPLLLLLVVLIVRWLMERPTERNIPRGLTWFVVLSGMPVVMEHVGLLQYAQHDFTALKAAPMLCGLAGWLLAQFPVLWSRVVLGVTGALCVGYFYRTNPLPGRDGGRYDQEMRLGGFIARNAAQDEVVFAVGVSTEPQVVWYARRNVIGVVDRHAAEEFLSERGLKKGVLISQVEGRLIATHIGS